MMHNNIISCIQNEYNILIDTVDVLKRESVLYDESLSRKIYVLNNTSEKYILKTYSKYDNLLISEVYQILEIQDELTIMPLKNKSGFFGSSYDGQIFFLFPFRELISIRNTNEINILNNYTRIIDVLNNLSISPNTAFARGILKTIFYTRGCNSEIKNIIESFFPINQIVEWLIEYYRLCKDITFNVIHGSLWEENIYICNDRVIFIDFDNVTIGDPYYDYASLCLMFYSFGIPIDSTLGYLKLHFPGFDFDRFFLSAVFTAIKCVQHSSPFDVDRRKRELNVGILFINDLQKWKQL